MPAAAMASVRSRQAGHCIGVSSTSRTYCFCLSAPDSASRFASSNSRFVTGHSRKTGPHARDYASRGVALVVVAGVSDGLDGSHLDLADPLPDVGAGAIHTSV